MVPTNNILFLDIETVPQYESYNEMPAEWKLLWETKAAYLIRNKEEETFETIYNKAGIYSEFGKIICICCGNLMGSGNSKRLAIRSFYGDDEKELLKRFAERLAIWTEKNPTSFLCAHNGKEFDFPFLCRRFIINNLPIPAILNIRGKKPWETNHLDTMDMWRFGDYKSYTSLSLLAQTLGIPTPKDDINGSKVWEVYWKDKELERIVMYCRKDVVALAQVYLRLNGDEVILPENVEYST